MGAAAERGESQRRVRCVLFSRSMTAYEGVGGSLADIGVGQQGGEFGASCVDGASDARDYDEKSDGRIDCDHVSGLLTRRDDRWPRWGPRSSPKQSGGFESRDT